MNYSFLMLSAWRRGKEGNRVKRSRADPLSRVERRLMSPSQTVGTPRDPLGISA